jgi:preprotein translocase subunit SecA
MLKKLVRTVVGDPHEKEVKRLQPIVDDINELEPSFQALSDEKLRDKTQEFIGRYHAGESLDDLLPEAFAAVREAARRTIGLRHYDVQLIGGIVLHQGKIAEMKTGEGKTLVATLPLYLNALTGRGVHLVTPNDYLSKVGAQWMGPIYHALGLTVGVIQSSTGDGRLQPAYVFDPTYIADDDRYQYLRPVEHRRQAYEADITYGTNNEFGFDYLRDNMVWDASQRVQRELYYAIVDEVDNILIDEARTPLIISGPAEESDENYRRLAQIVPRLRPEEDYTVDEKARVVTLTDEGISKMESWLGVDNIYAPEHFELTHYLDNALKAHALFKRDRDYIVNEDGEVIIVDEFTGRLMYGRRYSEGLHQAIEAKEGVKVQRESMTLATITFQNYFRMYEKLAGMTGTADTEAEEFAKIYDLDVVVIPTHRPMIRIDYPDSVYRTEEAKYRAVAREILQMHCMGRPVLVGTASIERSEHLHRRLSAQALQTLAQVTLLRSAIWQQQDSLDKQRKQEWNAILSQPLETIAPRDLATIGRQLKVNPNPLHADNVHLLAQYLEIADREKLADVLRNGIPHEVLNAKQHEREATIIAQAGRSYSVTIATNMAGRGVDILLGGNPEGLARLILQKEHPDMSNVSPDMWNEAVVKAREITEQDREKVLSLGGLHIVGTERHEARRIDNQLRGRAGRQGDPGSSRFFLSLEDDLMRRFGGQSIANLMERLGVEDDVPIEHGLVSKTIENSQSKVEGYNFDIRKHVLEYDDVVNKQREVIYSQRLRILEESNLRPIVMNMVADELRNLVSIYTAAGEFGDQRDLQGLLTAVRSVFPLPPDLDPRRWEEMSDEAIADQLVELAEAFYDFQAQEMGRGFFHLARREGLTLGDLKDHPAPHYRLVYQAAEDLLGEEGVAEVASEPLRLLRGKKEEQVLAAFSQGMAAFRDRSIMLEVVDRRWTFHLTALDDLRTGIGLRAYGQQDPLVAFKKEAHEVFNELSASIQQEIAHLVLNRIMQPAEPVARQPQREMFTNRDDGNGQRPARATGKQIGRNDPCPCGSGKKYKHCHLRKDGKLPAAAAGAPVDRGGQQPRKRPRRRKKRSRRR